MLILFVTHIPVIPHKAVVEGSKTGNLEDRLVVVNHGCRPNPLMDGKVVGVVFFGVVAMVAVVMWPVTSPQLLDVVWCSVL